MMRRNPFVSENQIDISDPEEARDHFDVQYSDLALLERLHGESQHESAESIVRDMIRDGWVVTDELVEYARGHEIERFDAERVYALRAKHEERLGTGFGRRTAALITGAYEGLGSEQEREDR